MSFGRLSVTLAVASTMLASASVALAASTDPAGQKIEAFNDALIRTMKAGKGAGADARFNIIAPAVDAAFDLPAMTGFAVGPNWSTMSPADRTAVTAAFRRFTIANYVKNFDSYNGQKIALVGDVQTRGVDKLVRTEMTGGGDKVTLSYRMRQSGGAWKVIDVFYNGSISQLTTQRSDFSATLNQGGAKALIAKLNTQSDRLLK